MYQGRIMRTILSKLTMSFAVLLLLSYAGLAQRHGGHPPSQSNEDAANRVGGKISEITSSAIKVKNREGVEQTINVTDKTVYNRNRESATLSSFKVDDFVMAFGSRDASGQFTAERVMGGDQPPRGPGGPGGPFRGVGGEVTAVDASAGTISVKNRGGETETIYTTAQTTFNRNRQSAALTDFKAGDHVRADGARNDKGQFIASRIFGGDQKPQQ